MEHGELYRTILKYALGIAGSELVLSSRMNIPVAKIRIWLDGIAPMPTDVFLLAVDVIVAATPAEISRCRDVMLRFEIDPPPE